MKTSVLGGVLMNDGRLFEWEKFVWIHFYSKIEDVWTLRLEARLGGGFSEENVSAQKVIFCRMWKAGNI